MKTNVFGTIAVLLALLSMAVGIARSDNGVIWYTGPLATDTTITALAAERYSYGITDLDKGLDAVDISTRNPDFTWLIYNSVTDNYQGGEEDGLVTEDCYLHYTEATAVVIGGDTLIVEAGGRIPVYDKRGVRQATSFRDDALRIQLGAFVNLAVARPFAGTDLYADGIFLDNANGKHLKHGTIIAGGHVAEHPTQARIDSQEFREWYWAENLKPFLRALRDTLNADGHMLVANVASYWDDEYATAGIADVLLLEWQYSPVRNSGADIVMESYRRDSLAAARGVRTWYVPHLTRDRPNKPGTLTLGEAQLGGLTWHLVTRTAESIFTLKGQSNPKKPDWELTTWCGAIDAAMQLGAPTAPPYLYAHGVDPVGYTYQVFARPHEHGLVLLRNRHDYRQGIQIETTVEIPLPGWMIEMDHTGNAVAITNVACLRNGTGRIFLHDGEPEPPAETRSMIDVDALWEWVDRNAENVSP